eukprot:169684-Pyramimonas_sp.AAC.1
MHYAKLEDVSSYATSAKYAVANQSSLQQELSPPFGRFLKRAPRPDGESLFCCLQRGHARQELYDAMEESVSINISS